MVPLLVGRSIRQSTVGRNAVAIRSSMPQRGRLDINDRSVVVTARLGAAMILQRIPLNAYKGVAAQLDASGETTVVNVVLRHHDPAYTITLDKRPAA
jgi:hypothetical protein